MPLAPYGPNGRNVFGMNSPIKSIAGDDPVKAGQVADYYNRARNNPAAQPGERAQLNGIFSPQTADRQAVADMFKGKQMEEAAFQGGLAQAASGREEPRRQRSFKAAGGGGDIPGFAEGGDPPVGKPAIVGENGPELIVPKQPITVLPNEMLVQDPTGNTKALATPYGFGYSTNNGTKPTGAFGQPAPGAAEGAFNALANAPGTTVSNPGAEQLMERTPVSLGKYLPQRPASLPPPKASWMEPKQPMKVGGIEKPDGMRVTDFRRFMRSPGGMATALGQREQTKQLNEAQQAEQDSVSGLAAAMKYASPETFSPEMEGALKRMPPKAALAFLQGIGGHIAEQERNRPANPPTDVPSNYEAVPTKFLPSGKPAAYELKEKEQKPPVGVKQIWDPGQQGYAPFYVDDAGHITGPAGAYYPAQSQEPSMTAEDVAAANAMGADVTVKNGNATITSKAKAPKEVDQLHKSFQLKNGQIMRLYKDGTWDMVDSETAAPTHKAPDGKVAAKPAAEAPAAPAAGDVSSSLHNLMKSRPSAAK